MSEIYISYDVEADGPIPGENSMLALGAVAITRDGTELGEFYYAIEPLSTAKRDKTTMFEFWERQPAAWAEVNNNPKQAQFVMQEYAKWLKKFTHPIQAAYPAGFDFTWLRWYMCKFVRPDWDFSCLDMKTMAADILNATYRDSYKGVFPKRWLSNNPFPHHALEDARTQAHMLVEMLKDRDKLHADAESHRQGMIAKKSPN